ncbi:MAG TPA: hypothetical protein DCE62_08900 [Glaciecola sp.]|nr:hypothetical protein [Glaciecola sp.]
MNNHKTIYQCVVLTLCMLFLYGCGGSKADPVPPIIDETIEPTVPQIIAPKLTGAKLKPANSESFSQSVKNGIFANYDHNTRVNTPALPSIAQSDSLATPSSESFSQTITQEIGVDEMDIMKFDGQHLYVVERNIQAITNAKIPDVNAFSPMPSVQPIQTQIRVLAKQPDDSLQEQSTIVVLENGAMNYTYLRGMYLHDEQLVVVGEGYESNDYTANNSIWWGGQSQFMVELFAMNNTAEPVLTNQITVDGYLISSKRIDNQLLLVSSYMPSIPTFNGLGNTDAQRLAGYNTIQATPINDLIPSVTVSTNPESVSASQPLFAPQDCYIPENATALDSTRGMIILTMIDLDDPTQRSVKCVNGQYDDVYVTTDAVFVHGNTTEYTDVGEMLNQYTVVHHFALATDQFIYNGTVELAGTLGWSLPNLRLSATDSHLRAVTTEFMGNDSSDRFDHSLHIVSLTAQNNQLNVVASLPNANAPAELGKPNEDIRAVRYFGDTAYMVTFEQIDPLYVIDVSNPSMPMVTGELEMPGYSSYLHPINENFILGIGQNVPVGGFDQPPALSGADEFGAKVALFDVSGTPRIVDEYIFANGYSPAEFDYHALTYLPQSDTAFLFAMPMQSWTMTDNIWGEDNRLELFQVDLTGNASMSNDSRVTTPNTQNQYYGAWEDRAVVIGDVIYYVKASQVWQTTLSNTAIVNGPY